MDYHVVVVTLGFIVCDFFTGIVKAIKEKNLNSSIMRQGLFNKLGSIIAITVGALAEYAQNYLDLGIHVPVTTAICTYICLMELTSIIENIGKINNHILPKQLLDCFGKLKEIEERDNE